MFDDGIELHSKIRDEHMRRKMKAARGRDEDAIRTDANKDFGGSVIEAVDAAG